MRLDGKPRNATIGLQFRVARAVAVCLLAVATSSLASARILTVGKGQDFATVREALAAARAGDSIEVHPGNYQGNLALDRTVSLIGVGKPVVRGDGTHSIITVTADGCTIRGLVLERSGPMLATEDSGILLKSNRNIIEQNELRDVLFGIYLYHADDNLISGNTIIGRPLVDLGGRGSGVHIWNSERNTLVGNTITQVRDGMYLQNTYHSVIRNNRIFNLRYGLHYMWSDDNVFEDNLFYDNIAGAAVMYSHRIQMRRNVFRHNRGYSSYGILFQENDDCILEDNIISDNAVGIFMEAMRRGTVRRNLISANDVALQVFQSAAENLFEDNNFVDNLSPMLLIGGKTSTRWNGATHGNYWSDYEGYDLDGDGVGDLPHKIVNVFDHLEGNHPRLRLYLLSPAAQALALAERGFPLLEHAAEADAKPLMRPVILTSRAPSFQEKPTRKALAVAIAAAMLLASIVIMSKAGRR